MIGGWTAAAALQSDFDATRETISALAASPSASPWVMTTGLAVTGLCHCVTAAGLRSAHPVGRVALAVAGGATAAVAALPVDISPQAHGAAATVAFVGLTVWPALAARRSAPLGLDRRTGLLATAGLSALLVWFVLELQQLPPGLGSATGLSERALAGAQSLWPLAVVLLLRARNLRDRPAPRTDPRKPRTERHQLPMDQGESEHTGKGTPR